MRPRCAAAVVKCGMARHPYFVDDEPIAAALDQAADAALRRLADTLPELATPAADAFRDRLRDHLAAMLCGRDPGLREAPLVHGEDAFGDRFDISTLPLPRPASGYAVQRLDTDTLLDRASGRFLPVRNAALEALFASFDEARSAARAWLAGCGGTTERHPLAIVPATYDTVLGRHVLILGVLTRAP